MTCLGRDPSSRGQGVTGFRAWTASVIISSAFAGRGAGWWWKTPSSCTWIETTAASTLCCSLTQSSKWKWAARTQTPDMESALRTSLGRSAVCSPPHCELQHIAYIYAWGYVVLVMHTWPVCFCPGVWSSNAAAIDRLIGGVMKLTGWQTPVTISKCNASMGLLRHGRTHSLNGQIHILIEIYNHLSLHLILNC